MTQFGIILLIRSTFICVSGIRYPIPPVLNCANPGNWAMGGTNVSSEKSYRLSTLDVNKTVFTGGYRTNSVNCKTPDIVTDSSVYALGVANCTLYSVQTNVPD